MGDKNSDSVLFSVLALDFCTTSYFSGCVDGSVTDICKTGWGLAANVAHSSAPAFVGWSQLITEAAVGAAVYQYSKEQKNLWPPLEVSMSYLLLIVVLASWLHLIAQSLAKS